MIFNFERRNRGSAPWEGTQPLTSQAIVDFFHPGEKGRGVNVSETNALAIASVYRAATLLAGTFAGAGKNVLNEDGEPVGRKTIIDNPHSDMDPFVFWEHVMMTLLFHGNFYGLIERAAGGNGPIQKIHPLDPTKMEPKVVVSRGRITEVLYVLTLDNNGVKQDVGIPATDILHIKGVGGNWLKGQSVISASTRVFSNAIMTDTYAEQFYGNGSLLSGVLTTDKRLDEKSAGALKNRWRQKIQGIDNAFDIVVLDAGTAFMPISLSPQDSQFIEARRFNVEEIGRMFGVPKELLGEAGQSTPIDPEQVAITFVQFTLSQWGSRIQSAIDRQVLSSGERLQVLFKDLILANERVRSSAAVMWRTSRILSINEIRVDMGKPPLDSEEANDPLWFPDESGDATDKGTNLGNQEQPVPDSQDVEDQSPTDMNDS